MTYIMTRIALYGQTDPLPIPETVHLTPEQRAEYTFIVRQPNGDEYLIPEMEARKINPLVEHLAVGSAFAPLP
jgi:hypothetical protein